VRVRVREREREREWAVVTKQESSKRDIFCIYKQQEAFPIHVFGKIQTYKQTRINCRV